MLFHEISIGFQWDRNMTILSLFIFILSLYCNHSRVPYLDKRQRSSSSFS